MKLDRIYRIAAEVIIALMFFASVCGLVVLCTGCSSIETETKVEPIPVKVDDYATTICGMWEGINSQNIGYGVRFDFKPNANVYLYVKQGDQYIEVPADGTYEIYDNKILHMMWQIKKSATETTYSEEFWHITINGKIMYLSNKKLSKDGESYVVTLTMKKINNVANVKEENK